MSNATAHFVGLRSPTRIVCSPSSRRNYTRKNSLTSNGSLNVAANDSGVSNGKEVALKPRVTRGVEVATSQFSQINTTLQISFNINDIRRKLSPTAHATKRTSNKLEFFNTSITTEKTALGKEFDPLENRLIDDLFSDDDDEKEIAQCKEDMGDLKLRNNLQSRILRECRGSFFNKSMMKFNSRKNSKERDDTSRKMSNDETSSEYVRRSRPSVAFESNVFSTNNHNTTTHSHVADFTIALTQKTNPAENEIEGESRVTFQLGDNQNQEREINNSKDTETDLLNDSQISEKTCTFQYGYEI